MGPEDDDRRRTLHGLPADEIVRGLWGLADDLRAVGNHLAGDFLDAVVDRFMRESELCTFTPGGWDRNAPDPCGRFARYFVMNTGTGESGFACPGHHGKGDDADAYFDMYAGTSGAQ